MKSAFGGGESYAHDFGAILRSGALGEDMHMGRHRRSAVQIVNATFFTSASNYSFTEGLGGYAGKVLRRLATIVD